MQQLTSGSLGTFGSQCMQPISLNQTTRHSGPGNATSETAAPLQDRVTAAAAAAAVVVVVVVVAVAVAVAVAVVVVAVVVVQLQQL